jgi:mannose-6-phosphate isomerase-like protein (cupin superfamily)
MKVAHIDQMIKGWIIGDFSPSVFNTADFEVAIKNYKKGDYEEFHHHKIASEFTVILDGSAEMSGIKYHSGDIVRIDPNQSTDFKALTDVKTVVIKLPSVRNDKYLDKI